MNRLSRAVTAVLAAGLAVPLWAAPASAETATDTASSAAYFNRAGISQPPGAPAAPPNLVAEADGVGPTNLAVAAQGGEEDKVSFLFFSLSALPLDATITKAVLRVPLVAADNANVRVNADPAQVVACKILGSGFSEEDGTDLALAPDRDCPAFAAQATQEGESYVFDITALAASWAEVNDGLALTRKPEGGGNFQVVLNRAATLDVEFTAPPAAETGALDGGGTAFDPGVAAGTADLGGGFSGGTSESFADAGSGSADLGGGLSAVTAPLTTPGLPETPAPATAGDAPVVAAPVSAPVGLAESLAPTAGFFLAALLLVGALVFLSLVMGDPRVPVAGAGRTSRLSQALSARSRGAGLSALGSRTS